MCLSVSTWRASCQLWAARLLWLWVIKPLITFAVCHKHATLAARCLTLAVLDAAQRSGRGNAVLCERRYFAGIFPLHTQRGSRQRQGHDVRGIESAADFPANPSAADLIIKIRVLKSSSD